MHLTPVRRGAIALALSAVSALALQGLALPAAHATAPVRAARTPAHTAAAASRVGGIEAATARTLAASLADPAWRAQVRAAALPGAQVDLGALASRTHRAPSGVAAAVAAADRGIAAAKGLDPAVGSLLRLRLGADSMRSALTASAVPLVAVADTGRSGTGRSAAGRAEVTAYDSAGRVHLLSARQAPRQAVYVIDVDVSKAMASGLAQVDRELAAGGLRPAAARPAAAAETAPKSTAASGGYWTTKVNAVWLNDDEETWIEGDAEIFSVVSGFGLDGTVRVDTVDMPYLDTDHHTYYPNQIIVNWSSYKYDEADLVMMEDDGDTNYSALAKALADALLTITDQGAYIPLVDAILAAMPDSWWTNDPDYVDSWYALAESSSGTLNGARGNGWMTVSPYWVAAL
ncbi:DUF3103 family protein [Streptomyces sp. V4-01]|uniref:DUF3103 family protein n=1 Tax=Actinacidiphila polyblastidii TaxID=3110430 RepID=A0ABU7PLE0_9ACTN|nr:DUF3103 family protein [Streptomyces sp. V4-01]